jgi:hypothetical protein
MKMMFLDSESDGNSAARTAAGRVAAERTSAGPPLAGLSLGAALVPPMLQRAGNHGRPSS